MSLILKVVCDICGKEINVPGEFSTVNLFDHNEITEEGKKKLVCFLVKNVYILSVKSIKEDKLINLFFCSVRCKKEYLKAQ